MILITSVTKNDEDAAKIREWLAKDAVHQANGITEDDIFAEDTETIMIHDGSGPLMAVRLHRALRVAIQFAPNSRIRTAKVGSEVVEWFKSLAQAGKFKEIIVRPGGKADKFAEKLGFKSFIGRFIGV